ncbi:hypothetical protein H1D32_14840 [Anaerobacillus sp. CMMVII]|uniref:YphA family membrane protein n=1 Tax=Anaerobacillus sp. CMMVII TaxID=2755588 RepID=UPI0021B81EB3|nr:hypothetical protein [Anaerobacillus sp. CMMVII]MCT8138877.1 hypothetical protein [Anaerobacillus sp. CMMVII]
MEGVYFYWIFWIGWIYTTFMLDKTKKRIRITIALLLLIIFSNKYINVGAMEVNSGILFCLGYGYYLISHIKKKSILYSLSISLILTTSYVTFRLFQLYDPVWVMFHPTLKLSLILGLMTIFLIREQLIRIGLLFIAIAQGEIFYTVFLNSIVPQPVIGQLESLDIVAFTASICFVWFAFEKFVAMLDEYVKQRTAVVGSTKRP